MKARGSVRLVIALVVSCFLGPPLSGNSTILPVYSTSDNGPGSLRQAIVESNLLGGTNTIQFSNVVTGTITLLSGALNVSGSVMIQGPGANVLSVSGNGVSRVFNLTGGAVSISGLTIANGYVGDGYGAGINDAAATLTVQNCVFSNNNATINGGGGALNITSPTTVSGSSFIGNVAAGGGAIYAGAKTTINNCTFEGNMALSSMQNGGAIKFAGGVSNLLYNSTVVSNTAYSGGGVSVALGPVYVRNTIVARNSVSAQGPDVLGAFSSQGYNLIGDGSDSLGFGTLGDLVGSPASRINPMVGPVQDNGGPTPTMAPLPGSPVIDQGLSGAPTIDQRGRPRPFKHPAIPRPPGGDGADIGAVEISPATFVVSQTGDSAAGSLRQALADAFSVDGDIITFAPGVEGTISLTGGELLIGKSVNIVGPGAGVLALSGGHASRVVHLTQGSTTLSGLTLCDGLVTGTNGPPGQNGENVLGGGVLNEAALVLSACVVSSNSITGGTGGGPDNLGFAGNGGNGTGAGIANLGSLVVVDTTVTGNTAAGGVGGSAPSGTPGTGGAANGGGIYTEGPLSLNRCTVSYNSATAGAGPGQPGSGNGGGIYNISATTLTNCTIALNSATGSSFDFGGGISDSGGVALRSSTVCSNQADYGGGIYGGPDLGSTIVAGNSAPAGDPDVSGTVHSSDYNLIQNLGGATIVGATAHNITGQDPLLGPLRDNGGPTFTMALLAGSPAVDKGNSFGAATDQRGGIRPFVKNGLVHPGDGSDIGAFEVGSYLRLTEVRRTGVSDIRVSLTTDAGNSYALLRRDTLATGAWSTVATNIVGTGTSVSVTNTGVANLPQGYYLGVSAH